MDHKKIFESFKAYGSWSGYRSNPENKTAFGTYISAEQLYQAIKARLIEELITENRVVSQSAHGGTVTTTGYRLIDTTEPSNES